MQKKPFVNPHQFTTAQRRAGLRTLVLMHLKKFGGRATAREVADSIGKPLNNIWPRFTDLVKQGSIRDTGLRVHGKGRPQVIWADTETTQPVNDKLAHDLPNVTCQADAPGWFKNFGV